MSPVRILHLFNLSEMDKRRGVKSWRARSGGDALIGWSEIQGRQATVACTYGLDSRCSDHQEHVTFSCFGTTMCTRVFCDTAERNKCPGPSARSSRCTIAAGL